MSQVPRDTSRVLHYNYAMRVCAVCRRPLNTRQKTYCSTFCRNKPEEQAKRGRGRRPWNYNRKPLVCTICGKMVMLPRCHLAKRQTCSRICATKNRQRVLSAKIPAGHFRCHKCRRILPWEESYNKYLAAKRNSRSAYCKNCHVEKNRSYRSQHRDRIRIRTRDYMRRRFIRTTGQRLMTDRKRTYPQDRRCELCRLDTIGTTRRLVYHHWDDAHHEFGMWICTRCHAATHWLDAHEPSVYYALKATRSADSPQAVKSG